MKNIFDLKIVAEIALVFAVVLTVKEVADNMAITGAGSIAMWCGIIAAIAAGDYRTRDCKYHLPDCLLFNRWKN